MPEKVILFEDVGFAFCGVEVILVKRIGCSCWGIAVLGNASKGQEKEQLKGGKQLNSVFVFEYWSWVVDYLDLIFSSLSRSDPVSLNGPT